MKKIYQWNKKSNRYNSLNIYAHFLGDIFEDIWGVKSEYIYPSMKDCGKIIKNITQKGSNNIIFWHYGVFDPYIRYIQDYSNVVFVYHNITPAIFFWKTDILSSMRAIGTYLQLMYLPKKTNWITVSQFNKECLFQFKFKNIKECEIVPSSIPVTINAIRNSKEQTCTLLYVGRIIENKNCIELLSYIKTIATQYNKKITFIVVGKYTENNRYGQSFKEEWEKLQSIENLTLKWYLDIEEDMLNHLYKKSWIYVSTSLHEGFGIPVCEAILNGTPAVYLECGGQEKVLDNRGMIKQTNKIKFPQYVLSLIQSETLRENLLNQQYEVLKYKCYPNNKTLIKKIYGIYIN